MNNLNYNTDALVWAQEFMKIWQEQPIEMLDEDLMLGWFANAIMTGYDAARQKYETVNKHDFIMQGIMSMSKKIDIPYDEQILEYGDEIDRTSGS